MFDENGNGAMAMVNHLMNVKDSRWLQVEVCREFQRGQCSREFNECKFAHPPAHVEVQNGRVTACYDSIKKGRCNRENPKCKYLHPPQHIKDQLLINGRNNLALKNLIMNQLTNGYQPAVGIPGQPQLHAAALQQHPFLAQQLASVGGNPMGGLGSLAAAGYPGYYAAISPGALYSPAQPSAIPVSSAASQSSDPQQQTEQLSVALGMSGSPLGQGGGPKPRTDRVEALAAHANSSAATMVTQSVAAQPSTGQSEPVSGIGKKRRLEEDGQQQMLLQQQLQQHLLQQQLMLLQQQQADQASSSQSPLLLAALQQQAQQAQMAQAQKRLALEAKSGVPVYQPPLQVSAASAMSQQQAGLAAYYAQPQQFFAAPGTTSYIPALALGGVGGATLPAALPPNANNTASVAYFDESGQLLDTLPVCRDFKQAHCERPSCRYVHLLEDYVEVHEGKVTVCRDYAKGKCSRVMCKYYHVPILHPGASPLLLPQPSSLLLTPSSQHSLFSIGPLQSV